MRMPISLGATPLPSTRRFDLPLYCSSVDPPILSILEYCMCLKWPSFCCVWKIELNLCFTSEPLSLCEQPSPPPLLSWSFAIYDKWTEIHITGEEGNDLVLLQLVLHKSKAYSSVKTSDSYSLYFLLSVGCSKSGFNCLVHKFNLTSKGSCHS